MKSLLKCALWELVDYYLHIFGVGKATFNFLLNGLLHCQSRSTKWTNIFT